MDRRTFIRALSGSLIAVPALANAQQPGKMPQSLLVRADAVIQ
jgi:hypothetical protein